MLVIEYFPLFIYLFAINYIVSCMRWVVVNFASGMKYTKEFDKQEITGTQKYWKQIISDFYY